jgi:hypothetical protein
MSTTTILLIAIPLLVLAAGVLLFATARRRDTDKVAGVMSSETARRDRGRQRPVDSAGGRSSSVDEFFIRGIFVKAGSDYLRDRELAAVIQDGIGLLLTLPVG